MQVKETYKEEFDKEYKNLNKLQKEAVDTIDGPVMVVAGPGTGKTQILALRIGHILKATQTKADSILCLTFTNSAVKAMRERLRRYIGPEASNVKVATFHSFGLEILEKFYTALDLEDVPKLMDDADAIILCDEILHGHDWQYLRPRSDASRYFRDLKSLVSLLKRERISPEDFKVEIETEINSIKNDEDNISSRGESKGKLKQDALKKIEGLERTLESVKFYSLYEDEKKIKNLFDYDDILESLNKIVDNSEEAASFIKVNYQYVLIDEHQDSSGVQNTFLEKVWGEETKPDIFVVGDDRQLIYGFGGASLEYFDNFKNMFGKAKLITLLENYRSTQNILDTSHELLQSALSEGKLNSNTKDNHPLRLVEAFYPRDEIIAAGLEIKEKIVKGADANQIAILVPKNRQVRSTIEILRDMGITVAGGESLDFFGKEETIAILRVLRIISNPVDGPALATSFFDKLSNIPPIKAHEFIRQNNMREFSLLTVQEERNSLFDDSNAVNAWLATLKGWMDISNEKLYTFVQKVGTEFLLNTAKNHEELVVRIEVLRTLLHLALMQTEKNPNITLSEFIVFLDRLQEYGESIPLAIFGPGEGVKVLTLHASKGLEFEYVWVAHMDERSFSGGRAGGFTLPESVHARTESRDEMVLKRQLYVALTRAKRFCTVSYSLKGYTGAAQELSSVVADIGHNFEKQTADQTEKIILSSDIKAYVENNRDEDKYTNLEDLTKIVAKDYEDRKVSVSLLNNFFECTWKWYFRNLLQLPEPKSDSLEFGNMVHGAIEQILKYKKEFVPEDKEVAKVISRWYKDRYPEISKEYQTEQSVSVSDERFPHLTMYGKIDLIEKIDNENVRVTDFKTGGVRKKNDIEKIDEEGRMSGYMRQLAMYSYLLDQSPKWKVDVSESRLEFVEAKTPAETFYNAVITHEHINMIAKDIADYDELVKTGQWVHRPCHYNSYGKNTECEYCKLAEIYK